MHSWYTIRLNMVLHNWLEKWPLASRDGTSRQRENCILHSRRFFWIYVMPFGLCNVPTTFQRLVDCVLTGLQWLSCLAYIDDIIIIGRSFEEHLHHLQQILDCLKSTGLKIPPANAIFFSKKWTFWGILFLQAKCLSTLLRHLESTIGLLLSWYRK